MIIWIDASRADVPRQESADRRRNVQAGTYKEPCPSSRRRRIPFRTSPYPPRRRPVPRAGTRSRVVPQQTGGRATPPGGTPGPQAYAPQGAYRAGPAHPAAGSPRRAASGRCPGRVRCAARATRRRPVRCRLPRRHPGTALLCRRPGTCRVAAQREPARSTRPGPTPTQALAAPAGATAAAEPKKKDLTVNKLIAGAGAAATSAVLGSFFGALGTVGGAALGSVFSAVVTWLYQHSLDKTRETVKARVKLPGGGTVKVSGTTEVPAPRGAADQTSTRVFVTPGDQPTEVMSAVPPSTPARRRRGAAEVAAPAAGDGRVHGGGVRDRDAGDHRYRAREGLAAEHEQFVDVGAPRRHVARLGARPVREHGGVDRDRDPVGDRVRRADERSDQLGGERRGQQLGRARPQLRHGRGGQSRPPRA